MPPPPLTGRKRARQGLADVPAPREATRAVEAERSARALVALLPASTAPFILQDPPEAVAARPTSEVGEALVRMLAPFGAGSLDGAASALGMIMAWVCENKPDATVIMGSHVAEYLELHPPSQRLLTSAAWLRDWCGLDLPVRGPVTRPWKGRAPSSANRKLAFDLHIVEGLRVIATTDPSPFVRGQAAGWHFLAKAALRWEQSLAFVINSFVSHRFRDECFTVVSGATLWEKNPNPRDRKPRPVWAVVDDGIHQELRAALSGAEAVRCLILDTDSPSGAPDCATRWVLAPLSDTARVHASLHLLLRRHPISLGDDAYAYRHHSAKRFMPTLAEDSPLFTSQSGHEFGNFSMATSRQRSLEPTAAMLAAHTLRCSRLPALYAAESRVQKVFDRLCLAEQAIGEALARRGPDLSRPWGNAGPFDTTELAPIPADVPTPVG